MIVRPYIEADRSEWGRMRTALWPDQTDSDMAAWIARPDSMTVVAESDRSGLCGFVDVGGRSCADGCLTSPVAYLEGWYVDSDVRNRGVGAALIAAAEAWARSCGYREMASDTAPDNRASRKAHEALGYAEVGQAVLFRKDL